MTMLPKLNFAPLEKALASGQVHSHPAHIERVAADLRERIIQASDAVRSAVASGDKDYLRAVHISAKQASQRSNETLKLFKRLKHHFKTGAQIDPARIDPILQPAGDDEWGDLFLLTRSMWSMPYSKGYGRRLRFVVYDQHHESVIGIIGLQSPPADLAVRDELFDCPPDQKLRLINSTLDAYAVGAIPPYSFLLGGKLCAGLIASDEVRRAYWRQYMGKQTEMLKTSISQPLVAVTTTSAFGRSSQYNRLKYDKRLLAESIGYTQGFGMLHLEHVYPEVCEYLKMVDLFTGGGYGNGPKVRWQNMVRALRSLALPRDLLRHGVLREVFLYRFTEDFEQGMHGGSFGSPLNLSAADYAAFWRERWALPRATRFPSWNTAQDDLLLRNALAGPR